MENGSGPPPAHVMVVSLFVMITIFAVYTWVQIPHSSPLMRSVNQVVLTGLFLYLLTLMYKLRG